MDFFSLPANVRLQIYSELLVCSKRIVFVADFGPSSPRLFRSSKDGLCPALLRVSERVHSEARQLLYSNNHFQFPDVFLESTNIAPFLGQIGSQASLLRHICMTFPVLLDDIHRLHDAHIKVLDLIRDTCTSLTSVELLLDLTPGPRITVQALDLLNVRLKEIISLKEIVINAHVYDEEDIDDGDLRKSLSKYGYIIEITQLKRPKEVWICDERGLEFDNEEEYDQYMSQKFREEEENEWKEEYHRRRNDPYRKNDSDYD